MKPQFILTDAGFVIQELGDDGYYHMIARVAHGSHQGDDPGKRLVKLLNEAVAR